MTRCKKCGVPRARDDGLCLSCRLDEQREMERIAAIPSSKGQDDR
jgi:hypothetical protein